jgi:hypothetical protein
LLVYSSTKGVVSGGGMVSSEIGGGEKKGYKRKDKLSDREKDRVDVSEEKMSSKGKDGMEESRVMGPKTQEETEMSVVRDPKTNTNRLGKDVIDDSRVIGPKTQVTEMDMIRDTEGVVSLIGPLNKEVITEGSVKKDLDDVIGPKNKDEVKTKEEVIPSKVRNHSKVRVHSWIDNCIG